MRRFRSALANPLLMLALVLFPITAESQSEGTPLQLEVFINDRPTHLVASFLLLSGKRLAARASELADIGIKSNGKPEDQVPLEDIPGLAYRYDEAKQQLWLEVEDASRIPRDYDLRWRSGAAPPLSTGTGFVLNYDLLLGAAQLQDGVHGFFGSTATLDGRAFSPFGTFSQSAILRDSVVAESSVLRLNTQYAYADPERELSIRAGDMITGGLIWTRQIRLGGLQAQRNFGLRPDLVTMPLPSLVGTAAVPSTLDIYVNNLKTFSQEIDAGPYRLNNIPVVSGAGNALVVLHDSAGHEIQTNLPFYASPKLLLPGLTDFSVEFGYPRLSYGTPFDTYVDTAVGAGSLRAGIFDWLTLEGHAEGGAGLENAGMGAVIRTGSVGVASAAVAGSHIGRDSGLEASFSYETKFMGANLFASTQQAIWAYQDLASVTARMQPNLNLDTPSIFNVLSFTSPPASLSSSAASSSAWTLAEVPRHVNRFTVGLPLTLDSNVSASYIDLDSATGEKSRIITASWSHSLPHDALLFATAFTDVGDHKNSAFYVGVSFPLGQRATATTAVTGGSSGTGVSIDAAKQVDQQPGSFGWHVHDDEGPRAQRLASLSYGSQYGLARAEVIDDRYGVRGSAELEGAIATMAGGVFFARRIDDGFAVVDTGVPGIEVFHENRPAGVTNAQGQLLLPSLRSYQNNKIQIDPRNLPVDAEIASTREVVAPTDRSGVLVTYPIRLNVQAAVVTFVRVDGKPLPAGAHGKLEGGGSFVVGYDGRAYIKELAPDNVATIDLPDGRCRASFKYEPRPNEQVTIPSVICL